MVNILPVTPLAEATDASGATVSSQQRCVPKTGAVGDGWWCREVFSARRWMPVKKQTKTGLTQVPLAGYGCNESDRLRLQPVCGASPLRRTGNRTQPSSAPTVTLVAPGYQLGHKCLLISPLKNYQFNKPSRTAPERRFLGFLTTRSGPSQFTSPRASHHALNCPKNRFEIAPQRKKLHHIFHLTQHLKPEIGANHIGTPKHRSFSPNPTPPTTLQHPCLIPRPLFLFHIPQTLNCAGPQRQHISRILGPC